MGRRGGTAAGELGVGLLLFYSVPTHLCIFILIFIVCNVFLQNLVSRFLLGMEHSSCLYEIQS